MKYTDKIGMKDVITLDGNPIPNRKAVVNLDHNKVLGIVSPRYKLIHNVDLLDTVKPVVDELDCDFGDPKITVTKEGAVTLFRFLSMQQSEEIQKGDVVQFGIEFFNSYDGSMPIGFHIVAHRLVCLNGLIVPQSMTEIYMRHTKSANIGHIRNRIAEYIPKTTQALHMWSQWTQIKPEEKVMNKFLDKSVGKRLSKEFMTKYKSSPREKQNLWEFYNIITYHLSHNIKTRTVDKVYKQFVSGEDLTNRLVETFAA